MCVQRILSCLCSLAITGALAVGVYFFFFADDEDKQAVIDLIPEDLAEQFRAEDPFTGKNSTDSWENEGKGLQLTIINSLTNEIWFPYFETAISDWDSGTPDSLTLATKMGTPDDVCDHIMGSMRVCNGDYGDTKWKGVNNVLVQDTATIVASAAKMNEFYLKPDGDSGSDDDKQYTMCHEIGHGFGLAHTDESFNNRDLGNCMDYSSNPEANKQPGDTNYETLAGLYGTADGSYTSTKDNNNTNSSGTRQLQVQQFQQQPNNNHYRTNNLYSSTATKNMKTPEWIIEANREIHLFLINPDRTNEEGSRHTKNRILLHKNEFGEVHLFPIGNGYSIKTHILYN